MNPHEEDVFARIEDPGLVRRYLLESAKTSIGDIKEYYNFLVIREHKSKSMLALKQELDNLNGLIKDLKKDLPMHSEREVLDFLGEKMPDLPKKEKSHARHTDLDALNRLEKYLEDIEANLKKV